MRRYDEQVRRRRDGGYGYDEAYDRYVWGDRSRRSGGWTRESQGRRGWPGYDRERGGFGFAHDQAWPGADREEQGGNSLYGPARYGLGPYYQRLLNRRRPDEELQEEVEEALFYDSWVDAEAISVEVEEGVVSLKGELPSYDEIRYAIDDAWDVDGVRGVRSELSVRSEAG
jgi:osmotically-inducible protein OsmY